MYQEIRDAKGKLLFLYDPERQIIEIASRGKATVVDLTKYQQCPAPQPAAAQK